MPTWRVFAPEFKDFAAMRETSFEITADKMYASYGCVQFLNRAEPEMEQIGTRYDLVNDTIKPVMRAKPKRKKAAMVCVRLIKASLLDVEKIG